MSFPSSGVGKGRVKRCRGREKRVRPKRTVRGTGKQAELLQASLVRWQNVSLFSAVNSPGQQIWLLVPFSVCYKNCSPVRPNAVVAPANFCNP